MAIELRCRGRGPDGSQCCYARPATTKLAAASRAVRGRSQRRARRRRASRQQPSWSSAAAVATSTTPTVSGSAWTPSARRSCRRCASSPRRSACSRRREAVRAWASHTDEEPSRSRRSLTARLRSPTRSREIIRRTQAELVEAERLAAVGESRVHRRVRHPQSALPASAPRRRSVSRTSSPARPWARARRHHRRVRPARVGVRSILDLSRPAWRTPPRATWRRC